VDLLHQIIHQLEIKLPDHDPDNLYPLSKISEAAKHVLHGASHTKSLQPNVMEIVPPAASSSPTTSIKTEELSGFFEQFAQTLAKAMGSQGTKLSGYTYN
jgi:hypothetical protein